MADRSSASTTELEVRDRAIVERVAAGLLPRRARDTFATAATTVGVEDEGRAVTYRLPAQFPYRSHAYAPCQYAICTGMINARVQ